jgi:hypothetical protein
MIGSPYMAHQDLCVQYLLHQKPHQDISQSISLRCVADHILKELPQNNVPLALYHSPSAPGPAPATIVYVRTIAGNNSEVLSRHRARLRAILRRLKPTSDVGRQRTESHLLYRKHSQVYFSHIELTIQSMIQAFWVLWWYNFLLPCLFLRMFYAITRRKIFPYPTLQELRKRRKEVARANVFGDTVQARLTPSSPFGLQELWRIFKVFNKPKVDKANKVVNDEGKAKLDMGKDRNRGIKTNENVEGKETSEPVGQVSETTTVLDDSKDTKQDKDIRRAILQTLGGIADLHERIKK